MKLNYYFFSSIFCIALKVGICTFDKYVEFDLEKCIEWEWFIVIEKTNYSENTKRDTYKMVEFWMANNDFFVCIKSKPTNCVQTIANYVHWLDWDWFCACIAFFLLWIGYIDEIEICVGFLFWINSLRDELYTTKKNNLTQIACSNVFNNSIYVSVSVLMNE